ncbi:hypothetical protein POVWA2_012580 [Plasmodium ovale wallikeri]|uniref:Uncharacterized protein n=1 Tax=Plasmodium ovale wallikeri TaxID=864142 RepID=A0A1A8YNP9_PLAOA|nr:hypothetical protein POVWA1_011880 [Plasmodium ovale wallikeri]SBT33020.1 hypothetical protein POVWA2_012580 [Plasmodium ovale wallikeri]
MAKFFCSIFKFFVHVFCCTLCTEYSVCFLPKALLAPLSIISLIRKKKKKKKNCDIYNLGTSQNRTRPSLSPSPTIYIRVEYYPVSLLLKNLENGKSTEKSISSLFHSFSFSQDNTMCHVKKPIS